MGYITSGLRRCYRGCRACRAAAARDRESRDGDDDGTRCAARAATRARVLRCARRQLADDSRVGASEAFVEQRTEADDVGTAGLRRQSPSVRSATRSYTESRTARSGVVSHARSLSRHRVRAASSEAPPLRRAARPVRARRTSSRRRGSSAIAPIAGCQTLALIRSAEPAIGVHPTGSAIPRRSQREQPVTIEVKLLVELDHDVTVEREVPRPGSQRRSR
jgi:hypothetical protein